MRAFLTLALVALAALATSAHAARHALIIGNNSYTELTDLQNTHADAEAYAQAFRTLGFTVTMARDQSYDGMANQLDGFLDQIAPGDEVAFVFSGHGWSDGVENFLVPTDAPLQGSDRKLKRASFTLQNGLTGILDEIEKTGAARIIAIIDACRDKPFEPVAGTRSAAISRGLAPIEAHQDSIVVFSAGSGQKALDRLPGDGPNQRLSVFTRHFAPLLTQNIALETAISQAQRLTADDARSVNGHLQIPVYFDQTIGDTCLTGTCQSGTAAIVDPCDALYAEAKASASCFAYEGYLSACRTHTYRPIAEAFLARSCEQPVEETAAVVVPKEPEVAPDNAAEIEAYTKQVLTTYGKLLIPVVAPHRASFASCPTCAPFMVFCRRPIEQPSDFANRAVRTSNFAARKLVQDNGGRIVFVSVGQLFSGFQTGEVECAVTGGEIPK